MVPVRMVPVGIVARRQCWANGVGGLSEGGRVADSCTGDCLAPSRAGGGCSNWGGCKVLELAARVEQKVRLLLQDNLQAAHTKQHLYQWLD
jgi:hypothetical protein